METSEWLGVARQRLRGLEELVAAGTASQAEARECMLLAAAYGAATGIAPPPPLTVADIADYLTSLGEPGDKPVKADAVMSMRIRNGPNRTDEEIARAPSCPAPAMQVGVRKPVDVWFSVQLPTWGRWYLHERPGRGKGGGRPKGRADGGVTPGGA